MLPKEQLVEEVTGDLFLPHLIQLPRVGSIVGLLIEFLPFTGVNS